MASKRAFALTCLIVVLCGASGPDWTGLAKQFTGESEEVRQQAIRQLRKYPELEQILRTELRGPNKFLALDVVSTLELKGLLHDLVESSREDATGFFYSAINGLVDEKNGKVIQDLYLRRLENPHTSAPSKAVLIDTLSRMKWVARRDQVARWFKDPSFEVRGAAIRYLRNLILRQGHADYAQLIEQALRVEPYQLRVQAVTLVSELSPELKRKTARFLRSCLSDEVPEVRRLCRDPAGVRP